MYGTEDQIVVRRAKALDQAMLAAFGARPDALEGTAALVVDVTPHTRKHAKAIADALRALDENPRVPRPWRVAALGRPFRERGRTTDEFCQLFTHLRDTPESAWQVGPYCLPAGRTGLHPRW